MQLSRARSLARSGEARRIRERARLTVREVAKGIGVDPATVSRWERGMTVPRGDQAARWESLLIRLLLELGDGIAQALKEASPP